MVRGRHEYLCDYVELDYLHFYPHDDLHRRLAFEELAKLGREDIMVIAGGVIPAQDYDFLYKAGVAAIFGPGTNVAQSACKIVELLLEE